MRWSWLPVLFLLGSLPAAVIDLDLRTPAAQNTLRQTGCTWTSEGLFLPAGPLTPVPPAYPIKLRDLPPSSPPYQAALAMPDTQERSLTVTLLLCPATTELGQDNLFSIGRRSRWLSAQLGSDGSLLVGLANRWWILPVRAVNGGQPLRVVPGRWHAVTVGIASDGLVRSAVDGEPGADQCATPETHRLAPRRYDGPDEGELSFVDPGSARHFTGLVARVIVQPGLSDENSIKTLHQQLAPARMPAPRVTAFTHAAPVAPSFPAPAAPEPPAAAADDF